MSYGLSVNELFSLVIAMLMEPALPATCKDAIRLLCGRQKIFYKIVNLLNEIEDIFSKIMAF